jgi:hypothetical protein
MKNKHSGFATVVLVTMTIGGCLYAGSIAIRSLDPFPILEFVNKSGSVAAQKMYRWDFPVDPRNVRRVSLKSASSIDSNSTWSKFELGKSDAELIAVELHRQMAMIGDYIQRTKDCEQATRTITSIPIRSPTSDTPAWWSPPTGNGNATENMLWYPNKSYGVAQGCYTLYDESNQILWVYEYAAQHDAHWKRGERPAYEPAAIRDPES